MTSRKILLVLMAAGMPLALRAQSLPLPQRTEPDATAEEPPGSGGEARPPAPGLPAVAPEGYWVDNAPLNEVFQYLAGKARQQYFYNNEINAPEFNLTGHLRLEDPRSQMEDIAVVFGLSIYEQGNTVYVMNEAQLARLPLEVMSYQLKYLRGSRPGQAGAAADGAVAGDQLPDFEKLKSIMRPMLTKSVGQVEFEEKTNTLLITDNSVRLKRIKQLLERIDQPKQQIAVNVRVLRVTNTKGKRVGVDWRTSLGDGITVTAAQSLNAMFNLPDTSILTTARGTANEMTRAFINESTITGVVGETGAGVFDNTLTTSGTRTSTNSTSRDSVYQAGPGLVFDALQVEAIVHALEQRGVITQESCPTIITEDNEQGLISIVDRFPIITSNISETNAGQTITDEVRYQIDEKDPDAMENPEKSREIGVTLSVTPTLLPDGTVRMKLRPRVAKIVELIPGSTGNVYPRVSESTAEAISRIPAGQSLILGGFYDYNNSDNKSKVPLLGSIPVLNRLFKYKERTMEKVSLIFVITPSVYDASSTRETRAVNEDTRTLSAIEPGRLDEMSARLLPPLPPEEPPPPPRRRSSAPHPKATTPPVPPAPEAAPPAKRSWLRRMFDQSPSKPAGPSEP